MLAWCLQLIEISLDSSAPAQLLGFILAGNAGDVEKVISRN